MFLPAAYLKTKYTVYGSFYDLQINQTTTIPCRNLLEIYNKTYHGKANFTNILTEGISTITIPKLHQGTPDIIVLMMNPGSSEPRQQGYTPPIFHHTTAFSQIKTNPLVYAKPDITQYQIMRLMHEKNYHHARILNLSDIREPKSPIFIEKATTLTKHLGHPLHSVFCDERTDERMEALTTNPKIPIILAWGRDAKLLPLIEICLPKIQNRRTFGIPSPENPNLFAHPSPTLQTGKDKWLRQILEQ